MNQTANIESIVKSLKLFPDWEVWILNQKYASGTKEELEKLTDTLETLYDEYPGYELGIKGGEVKNNKFISKHHRRVIASPPEQDGEQLPMYYQPQQMQGLGSVQGGTMGGLIPDVNQLRGMLDAGINSAREQIEADYRKKEAENEAKFLKMRAELEAKYQEMLLAERERKLAERERELEDKERELDEKRTNNLGTLQDVVKAIAGMGLDYVKGRVTGGNSALKGVDGKEEKPAPVIEKGKDFSPVETDLRPADNEPDSYEDEEEPEVEDVADYIKGLDQDKRDELLKCLTPENPEARPEEKPIMPPDAEFTKTCPDCGTEFTTKQPAQKYCQTCKENKQ